MADAMWSDPADINWLEPSPRGLGHLFGEDETRKFLARNGLVGILRGHQYKKQGYEVLHWG